MWSLTCRDGTQGGNAASMCIASGKEDAIDLTDNDLVFITNGGCVENSAIRQPE